MRGGPGFSEVLLIFALIVVFVDPKQIPGLIRRGAGAIFWARSAAKKFFDDIGR
ncbi:MAG: hypothetical protein LBH93_07010 [Chitinispirillales bacterium]|jgi:Sec-independent protein translocase protein TatA|nr:hypothetical protein [Chitinispirillales bacterium]